MTARGVAQEDLFWQDADRKESSSVLREAHERRRLVYHGHCLMRCWASTGRGTC